jgi:hypothetical protein
MRLPPERFCVFVANQEREINRDVELMNDIVSSEDNAKAEVFRWQQPPFLPGNAQK